MPRKKINIAKRIELLQKFGTEAQKDKIDKITYLTQDLQPEKIRKSLATKYKANKSKEEIQEELWNLSDNELEQRYNAQKMKKKEEYEVRDRSLYASSWYGESDLEYWFQQPCWTVEQAALLIIGLDPKRIDWRSMQKLLHLSNIAKKVQDIRETANYYMWPAIQKC